MGVNKIIGLKNYLFGTNLKFSTGEDVARESVKKNYNSPIGIAYSSLEKKGKSESKKLTTIESMGCQGVGALIASAPITYSAHFFNELAKSDKPKPTPSNVFKDIMKKPYYPLNQWSLRAASLVFSFRGAFSTFVIKEAQDSNGKITLADKIKAMLLGVGAETIGNGSFEVAATKKQFLPNQEFSFRPFAPLFLRNLGPGYVFVNALTKSFDQDHSDETKSKNQLVNIADGFLKGLFAGNASLLPHMVFVKTCTGLSIGDSIKSSAQDVKEAFSSTCGMKRFGGLSMARGLIPGFFNLFVVISQELYKENREEIKLDFPNLLPDKFVFAGVNYKDVEELAPSSSLEGVSEIQKSFIEEILKEKECELGNPFH